MREGVEIFISNLWLLSSAARFSYIIKLKWCPRRPGFCNCNRHYFDFATRSIDKTLNVPIMALWRLPPWCPLMSFSITQDVRIDPYLLFALFVYWNCFYYHYKSNQGDVKVTNSEIREKSRISAIYNGRLPCELPIEILLLASVPKSFNQTRFLSWIFNFPFRLRARRIQDMEACCPPPPSQRPRFRESWASAHSGSQVTRVEVHMWGGWKVGQGDGCRYRGFHV